MIDFKGQDPVKAILNVTGGQGVNASIEALGAQETFGPASSRHVKAGRSRMLDTLTTESMCRRPARNGASGWGDKVIRSGLCPGGAERMKRLMRLMDTGRVNRFPLTTHRLGFNEVEKVFDLMRTKADGILKPLISLCVRAGNCQEWRSVQVPSWCADQERISGHHRACRDGHRPLRGHDRSRWGDIGDSIRWYGTVHRSGQCRQIQPAGIDRRRTHIQSGRVEVLGGGMRSVQHRYEAGR